MQTSRYSHTSTHRPSRQHAVHCWQTLLPLAKEDLYLVFDLLEFASILVKERAWLRQRERSQRSQVFHWCIRMMELANLLSNSCPLGCRRRETVAQLRPVWKHSFYSPAYQRRYMCRLEYLQIDSTMNENVKKKKGFRDSIGPELCIMKV